MTRDEIRAAFAAADQRLESLRDAINASPEAALLSGEWRVRDALSHIAARSNSLPIAERWLERVAATPADQPAAIPDIHDVNAGQVRDRTGLSATQLIDEAIAGHRAVVDRLDALDDDLLARPIHIPARNIETTFAAFLVTAGPGHEGNHLNDIEAALAPAQESAS